MGRCRDRLPIGGGNPGCSLLHLHSQFRLRIISTDRLSCPETRRAMIKMHQKCDEKAKAEGYDDIVQRHCSGNWLLKSKLNCSKRGEGGQTIGIKHGGGVMFPSQIRTQQRV